MEPLDREELIKARAALRRQVQILDMHFHTDDSWAHKLIAELRSRVREINELLEPEGAADA